jgi:hypothetical protein
MIRKALFLVALIVVFVAGMFFAAVIHFDSPLVTIEFINESGKEIKTIDVIHETGRFGKIKHSISDLSTGKRKQIRIWAPAESSYELVVTLADQKQVTGGQGYIEPGYKITEIIEGDTIRSEAIPFGAYRP